MLDALTGFAGEHFPSKLRNGAVWSLIPWSQRTATGELATGEEWTLMGSTLAQVRDGLGY